MVAAAADAAGGKGGGNGVTSSRQAWRSLGDISFQRSALFRNCWRSARLRLANFSKDADALGALIRGQIAKGLQRLLDLPPLRRRTAC